MFDVDLDEQDCDILKLAWHPFSADACHLGVLLSDGILRFVFLFAL